MATIKYYNQDSQQWESVSSGGSGDVTGPESNTDGQIAIFTGTTGKVIRSPSFHRWRIINGLAPDSLLIGEELQVSEIKERTADSGVTIENVLLKDGLVDGIDISDLAQSAAAAPVVTVNATAPSSPKIGDIWVEV